MIYYYALLKEQMKEKIREEIWDIVWNDYPHVISVVHANRIGTEKKQLKRTETFKVHNNSDVCVQHARIYIWSIWYRWSLYIISSPFFVLVGFALSLLWFWSFPGDNFCVHSGICIGCWLAVVMIVQFCINALIVWSSFVCWLGCTKRREFLLTPVVFVANNFKNILKFVSCFCVAFPPLCTA